MSCCSQNQIFCFCEGLEVGQCVTVVFCDRCVRGKIQSIGDGVLTLLGKNCKCYYINLDKVLYICGNCTVAKC